MESVSSREERSFQRGVPDRTVAFYGPDDEHASKVVVGVQESERDGVELLERWYERGLDVRLDPRIGNEVVAFLKGHGVRRTVVTGRIIGCPHEEGIDYPHGESCRSCPWWHGRDRWTGQLDED